MTAVDDSRAMGPDLGPRTAVGAGGLLGVFNAAAILSAADVHVAQRLGTLCGERDEQVLLAVALSVRAVRSGSVCVRLDDLDSLSVPEVEDVSTTLQLSWPDPDAWRARVQASPMVGTADAFPERPVRLVDGRLYLDRYWRDEQVVRRHVDGRLAGPLAAPAAATLTAACHRQFPDRRDGRQRLAAAAAVLGRLTVVTGGPGTGKTTTVARVLAVLQEAAGPRLRIALAAPTGKAAARLQEAVHEVVATMSADDQRRLGHPQATTLHRLLGWRPGSSTRFQHDADHHLPHDVVVVDETSMVSLPMMARLLEALRPDARLVLVGDPDQLASVEAGAVLGDLVARRAPASTTGGPDLTEALQTLLPDDVPTGPGAVDALRRGVVRLDVVHRHGAVIARLAAAVRDGHADEALSLLRAGEPGLTFVETAGETPSDSELADVRTWAQDAGVALTAAALRGDVASALAALESHRVLVAHRRGPAGVVRWAALVESWVADAWVADAWVAAEPSAGDLWSTPGPTRGPTPGPSTPWYPGRPLLVTRNDRDTGLYNGDTGVVVAVPQPDGRPATVTAVFGDPARPVRVRPHRLPPVETVHAMTVHRSQGSQFSRVSLVLPPATSPLLTRELLYTAVTRARTEVCVVGTEAALRAAIERPVRRASGLRDT